MDESDAADRRAGVSAPPTAHARLRRDLRVIDVMVRLWCRGVHQPRGESSAACAELLAYARTKLLRCPFAADRPSCSRCAVHCYRKDMRERIRAVMRYAGPRILVREPVMALRYFADAYLLRRRHGARANGRDGATRRSASPRTRA
jgi:hypothetical protein